jgi:hypothetical protein
MHPGHRQAQTVDCARYLSIGVADFIADFINVIDRLIAMPMALGQSISLI